MDVEKRAPQNQGKRRRCKILFGILAAIGVLAVVIPTTVVEVLKHKKTTMGPKANVFVPLYVYPSPGAWTPLEQV